MEPGILFRLANELVVDLASSLTFFLEPALEGVKCWKVRGLGAVSTFHFGTRYKI